MVTPAISSTRPDDAHPGFRHLILTWKIVPAGLAAAAVALPSALWALRMGAAAGDHTASLLGRAGLGYFTRLAKGTK